jgi:hypothetical protein
MSKNNNVNPGHYKVAGRDRMGENLGQHQDKQRLTKASRRTKPAAKKPAR